jgi:hypothetical protein
MNISRSAYNILFFYNRQKKRDIYASLSSRKVCHFLIDQK